MNEWVFNDTPSLKYKSAIGCQTNGKLKPNSHVTKYVKIHNIIKYSVKSCTL